MSFTNRGRFMLLGVGFRAVAVQTNYFIALLTDATAPTVDTNLMSDHTQIAVGNGYADGGFSLTPGATDFDSLVENDTNDRGELQVKDVVWTAAAGPIPSSGGGARYAVLTDDNVTVSAREIYAWWDLTTPRTISDTQTLTLQNCELRLTLT